MIWKWFLKMRTCFILVVIGCLLIPMAMVLNPFNEPDSPMGIAFISIFIVWPVSGFISGIVASRSRQCGWKDILLILLLEAGLICMSSALMKCVAFPGIIGISISSLFGYALFKK